MPAPGEDETADSSASLQVEMPWRLLSALTGAVVVGSLLMSVDLSDGWNPSLLYVGTSVAFLLALVPPARWLAHRNTAGDEPFRPSSRRARASSRPRGPPSASTSAA